MRDYQIDFIELAIQEQVLSFGDFELKSGRHSPYFFNAGLIRSGEALRRTGVAYAKAIRDCGVDFSMLFGPAYKGIPLATASAIAWAELYAEDKPVVYNRKEVKSHGEGGLLVGGPLEGRVLIIDDVITAGTAVREVIAMIQASEAELAGVVVGLDRQEKGQGELSAIQELAQEYNVPVISIIGFDTMMSYLSSQCERTDDLGELEIYRQNYGISQ